MSRCWQLTRKTTGEQVYVAAENWRDQYDGRSWTAVEVDRLPGPLERWADGKWAIDQEAVVDAAYLAEVGPRAIERAHAWKAVEAGLLLAGLSLPGGLLAREAAATGQNLLKLAATVRDKAEPAAAAELARIKAKRAARGDKASVL